MQNNLLKRQTWIRGAGMLGLLFILVPGCSKKEEPTPPSPASSSKVETRETPAQPAPAVSTSAKFLAWGQKLTPDFKAQLERLAAAKAPGQDVEFTVPLNPEDYQALAKIVGEDTAGQLKFRDEPDPAQVGTQTKKVHVYFSPALLMH